MLRRFEGGARTLSFALARRPASSRSLGSLLRRAAVPAAQPLIGNGLSRLGVRTYAQGPPGGGMGGCWWCKGRRAALSGKLLKGPVTCDDSAQPWLLLGHYCYS